jgi:adenylate cyclase
VTGLQPRRTWKNLSRLRKTALTGCAAGFAVMALQLADPGHAGTGLREIWFDIILASATKTPPAPEVAVIDIDRESLARFGPWPWPRPRMAELIAAAASPGPRVIAADIVFSDRNDRDPQALAETARLASAMEKAPFVLGMALDTAPSPQMPKPPPVFLVSGGPMAGVKAPVVSSGLAAPALPLAEAGRGSGILSLLNETGSPVRDVPLLAIASGKLWTSLALEAVRIGEGEGPVYVETSPDMIVTGTRRLAVPDNSRMRLFPGTPEQWRARTVSAAAVMDGQVPSDILAGKFLFIGSSAPEAGGLRPTFRDPFAPSVQIHADAAAQILAGRQPVRLRHATLLEALAAAGLTVAASAIAALLTPASGIMAALLLMGGVLLGSLALLSGADILADAAWPALAVAAAFLTASLARLAAERLTRQAVERRFAMHLAPEIVARIAADPGALRLKGERRTVTVLFTDIEGFTAMTETADPEALVALLDGYVDLACACIRRHGGMVDKVVGDAVHAFFNAPVDLAAHADKALECAVELISLTDTFRTGALAGPLGLGCTRIGIETGAVIVGDIGGASKLDYTAGPWAV